MIGKNYVPYDMFMMCLGAEKNYHHVENDGSYYTIRSGNTLYLLLEWSNGPKDWRNNFAFAAKPYKDMPTTWKAHRGFVRVWKSIEPYVCDMIKDPTVTAIVTIGYSHGAALAVLAHEYVWFNRPDIRANCITFAFEAPRVFKGKLPENMYERWHNLYVFRVDNDIVTHVPFRAWGYRQVGNGVHIIPNKVGAISKKEVDMKAGVWVKHGLLDCVNAHYQDNVALSLKDWYGLFPEEPTQDEWHIYEWKC